MSDPGLHISTDRPVIALTVGDVAGIGPEVVVRAAASEALQACCRPLAVGHPQILQATADRLGLALTIQSVEGPASVTEFPDTVGCLPCWNPGRDDVLQVPLGRNDARAGRAAYDYLVAATRAALAGKIAAITTAPLSKAALHAAGLKYPGHTEILAQECGVTEFGMMLYLPQGERVLGPHGLGVVHVTLHTSIRSVPDLITTSAVFEKIGLMNQFLRQLDCPHPRVAVCALNPHAGEEGLFGDEEARLILPGVEQARAAGMHAVGPYPADTLLKRAVAGEFDGVVAMYHDQGHIALKLIGFDTAVNITLGLPIVRTSPSHGTAFDIAGQGLADPQGFLGAVQVAARLAQHPFPPPTI